MCMPGIETALFTAIQSAMAAAGTAASAAAPTLSSIGSVLANPLTQAGLTVAGTGAQIMGQRAAARAADNAIGAEARRQRGFRENQGAIIDNIIGGSMRGGREEDIVRRERRLTKSNDAVRKGVPSIRGAQPGGPRSRSVESSGARSAAEFGAGTDRISRGVARSGAYRGNQAEHARKLMQMFGKLQTEGSLARGSQSVLPLELQAAQNEGQGLRTLGDALMATATLSALSNGFSGMFGGSTPPMPSPTLDPRMDPRTLGHEAAHGIGLG